MMCYTLIDYRYRDAGNYKANGTVALDGIAVDELVAFGLARLEASEFFIAEQLGVPPLYKALYRWSGGPTQDDHCWHELIGVRTVDVLPSGATPCGSATAFFERMAAVRDWQGDLSPHWAFA